MLIISCLAMPVILPDIGMLKKRNKAVIRGHFSEPIVLENNYLQILINT